MYDKHIKANHIKKLFFHAGVTLADVLWPKRCIVCKSKVPLGRIHSLCSDCISAIPRRCEVVIEPDRYFEQAICALPYKDNVRNAMIEYKFKSMKYISHAFSYALYSVIKDRNIINECDMICPVPIHPLRDREYNQSEIIASQLSEATGITMCPDILIKIKNLTPLSKMGYAMRRACIQGAIEFNMKYNIEDKNIILLDDIYTTGSTVDECAKILRMHGAGNVIVLTACYADTKGDLNDADADNFPYQEFWS